MKPDIMVLSPLRDSQMAILESRYHLLRADLAPNAEDFIEKNGQNCRAVVSTGNIAVDKNLLAKMPKVELIACVTAGFDQLNLADLKARNVRLTNTPDVLTDDVADVALMLMLATRRNLIVGDRYVRSGEWAEKGPMPLTDTTAGKRAGIVGLGRIGHAIAKRYESCGLEIGYFGRTEKKDVSYQFFASLLDMAKWADILVLAVTGGKETEKMVSKEVIHALGSGGSLINIARGTVVDEAAMIAALQSGALGTAGLDVYLNEPNINPAFYTLDNAVLYPHHGSATVATRDKMSQLVVDNLDAFYADKPLLSEVKF
ncbi:2-hydroxyacid dehydrogenase [Bartonella sp. LJL80]